MKILAFAVTILFAASVRADGPDDAGIAFFEAKVRPILIDRCYSCHSANAKKLRGGLRLDSKEGWEKGGDSGPAIVPGKPEESLLAQAILYDNEELQMPPKGKLADTEIALLKDWIKRGARSEKRIGGSQC